MEPCNTLIALLNSGKSAEPTIKDAHGNDEAVRTALEEAKRIINVLNLPAHAQKPETGSALGVYANRMGRLLASARRTTRYGARLARLFRHKRDTVAPG